MSTFRCLPLLAVLASAAFAASTAHAHGAPCADPFQTGGTISMPANYGGTTVQFLVPSGKRLQIEQANMRFSVIQTTDRTAFEMVTSLNGASTVWDLPPIAGTGYAATEQRAGGAFSVHAGGGTQVLLRVYRSGTTNAARTGLWSVSGCLVPG